MQQGREPRSGGGRRTHQNLVESIASTRVSTYEDGAWAIVDAVAELYEREGTRAHLTVMRLTADDDAQRRLAAALGCREEWVPCLLGASAHVLGDGPASRESREQLVAILVPWLRR